MQRPVRRLGSQLVLSARGEVSSFFKYSAPHMVPLCLVDTTQGKIHNTIQTQSHSALVVVSVCEPASMYMLSSAYTKRENSGALFCGRLYLNAREIDN